MSEHRASQELLHELELQVHAYLDSSISETVWLKRAKYLLAYPIAKYLRNEAPPPPDLVFRPSGCLRKWMKQRLVCFNRRNTHLWYSWYQIKRCALPCSDDFVEQTYEDHFKSLSTPDLGDEEVIDDIFRDETFLYVLDEVAKGIKKQLSQENRSLTEFLRQFPSQSATFNSSRRDGGQVEELRDLCSFDPISSRLTDELFDMNDYNFFEKNSGSRFRGVLERRCSSGVDDWSDLKSLSCAFDKRESGRNLRCIIQAVLEPFKVRVISKGEALPYYSMKVLQKAMHSVMREMDCFRLIGKPFCPTMIKDLVEDVDTEFDQWFSIDYSAATDGLSWKYSGKVFRNIIRYLPISFQTRALQVLGPHDLYYPTKDGGIEFKGPQQNGQLMGSILSFPILCLANLGVYLYVTREEHSRRFFTRFNLDMRNNRGVLQAWHQYRLKKVLVNGDDMLYAFPGLYWRKHSWVSGKVGLKLSVGKAYRHSVYANINSTSIHYDLRKLGSSPYQIDFLNVGLFFGQHKVQGTTDPKDSIFALDERAQYLYDQIGMVPKGNSEYVVNINQILKGSLPGRQSELLSKFLHTNGEEIRKECTALLTKGKTRTLFTRNLFLPLSLGGMGVDLPSGFKTRYTPIQKEVAYSMYRVMPSTNIDFMHPLPGYSLDFLDSRVSVPWSKPGDVSTVAELVQPTLTRETSRNIPWKMMLNGIYPYTRGASTFLRRS